MIREQTSTVVHDAFQSTERKTCALGQPRSSSGIGHKRNSASPLRAIQHFHQRQRNVLTVGTQFAKNLRPAQREFEQPGRAMDSAMPRGGHAIERVRDLSHAVLESGARFVVPGIAVTAADANISLAQSIDEIERAR